LTSAASNSCGESITFPDIPDGYDYFNVNNLTSSITNTDPKLMS